MSSAAVIEGLLPALLRLDERLQRAVSLARGLHGSDATHDPHRGLYVSDEETARLFARSPGAPLFATGDEPTAAAADAPLLVRLADTFELSPFDLDVVMIALAPELDLRYERLYGYLHDDITRRRPSVGLALDLLCSSPAEKLDRRRHFAPEAPLTRHGLLHVPLDGDEPGRPLLARPIALDGTVVRFLLGERALDPRLSSSCEVVRPAITLDDAGLDDETARALRQLARDPGAAPARLVFDGPEESARRRAAEAFAAEAGLSLLAADLEATLDETADVDDFVRTLILEAGLSGAVLYLDGVEPADGPERRPGSTRLLRSLNGVRGPVILSGAEARTALDHVGNDFLVISFPLPDAAIRRSLWSAEMEYRGEQAAPEVVAALADRFRLSSTQIRGAVAAASGQARWRSSARDGESPEPTPGELFAAARDQAGQELGRLAQKIVPCYGWDDIILPLDRREQLEEICVRVRQGVRVLEDWGFRHKLALGKGLNVLFTGPPGTGKTMAADVIAGQLGLDLYKIDLAGVVSKYIGETEKNLSRIFSAAESSNAILFFDEADALFGKRSEVRDSHDRYANIEISYLLQRMEDYDGVVVLSTNLRKNMDDAFVRRMHFTVEFPLPRERERLRIWERTWPDATPGARMLDLALMAHRFELTGGGIRNVALAAAFLAADDGGEVTMKHLLRATRREYQKMGKIVADAEFEGSSPARG